MIQQFAYVYGVVGILLLSGKNIKCGYSFFTLSQDDDNQKTLITKNGFYILRTGFTMRSGLGHPLNGLSLRKSSIKNHTTLFRGRAGSQPDQTQTKLHKAQHLAD